MPSLELKAEHFAQSVGEKEYYSSPSGSPVESAIYDSIIDGKVSGGEISTTYECTATLSVTVEGADSLKGHKNNRFIWIYRSRNCNIKIHFNWSKQ